MRGSEAGLLAAIRSRLRAANAGATPFEIWNPLLPAAIELADAYLRDLTLRALDTRVTAAAEAGVAQPLRAVRVLHGLNVVHEDLAWNLEHRSLAAADPASLRTARERAPSRVHDHAPALVEAFALPAQRLRAKIAEADHVSAVTRQLDAAPVGRG